MDEKRLAAYIIKIITLIIGSLGKKRYLSIIFQPSLDGHNNLIT